MRRKEKPGCSGILKEAGRRTEEGSVDATLSRYRASFAQERLWFLHELERGRDPYHVAFTLRLSGDLDQAALEEGLQTLVGRHAALRTTFQTEAGVLWAVVKDHGNARIAVSELPDASKQGQQQALLDYACKFGSARFDLATGPLFRVALLRLGDCEYALLWVSHHIIIDRASTAVLLKDLSRSYEAILGGNRERGGGSAGRVQ